MTHNVHGLFGMILLGGTVVGGPALADIFDDDADDPASEAAGEMRDRAERGETSMPDLAPGLQRNANGVIERRGVVLDSDGEVIGTPPPPVSIDRDGGDIDKSTQRRDSDGIARDQNVGPRHGGTLGKGDGSAGSKGMGNSGGTNGGSMGNSSGDRSGGSMGNSGGGNAGGGGGMGGASGS